MLYKSKYYNGNDIKLSNMQLSKVVVYGTGTYGALAIYALKQRNIKILNIIDDNSKNWNKDFCGYKITPPKILEVLKPDVYVIIASLHYKYMLKILKSFNINNYLHCDFLFNKLDLKSFKHTVNRIEGNTDIKHVITALDLYMYSILSYRNKLLNIKTIDLVLTERCTLKCKDCANLMQYYKKPENTDDKGLLLSFNNFINVVDNLLEARIIGGEPLMYKNISNIMENIIGNNKVNKVVIFTNGTIIPKDINIYKNSKVFFKISDYGRHSKHSKIPELENILKINNINFLTERVVTWQNAAIIGFQNRTPELTKKTFGTCCVNDALTLLHGNLYICPFSAHAENLHAIPHNHADTIDLIHGTYDEIYNKLYSFIYKKEYIEACNYCNGRDYAVGDVEAAVQVKSPIDYKLYQNA